MLVYYILYTPIIFGSGRIVRCILETTLKAYDWFKVMAVTLAVLNPQTLLSFSSYANYHLKFALVRVRLTTGSWNRHKDLYFRHGKDICHFFTPSRPVLGPTTPSFNGY